MLDYVFSLALSLPPLLYAVVALVSVWYIMNRNSYPKNIPPLPVRPYPILGHLPMLGKNTLEVFKKWQKSTGDIYSIYMGHQLAVVLSSYPILKEAFIKNGDYFSDRPHRFVDTDERFAGGIADTSGPVWKEQRGVTVSILKQFGMGKNWMAERINTEVKFYMDHLAKSNSKPIEVRSLTNACIANIICSILIGKRFELEDPYFQNFFQILAQQALLLEGTSILKVFPWLKYLPGDLFHAKKILKNEELFRTDFSLKYINEMRENTDEENYQNFIKSYQMEEDKRRKSGHDTTLNEQNLIMIMTNLFQAGTETTSTTILWALLFILHNPEVEKKLQQEIDEVIGTEKAPTVEDKIKLKYVNAVIMETQRLGGVGPLGLPHLCTKTTTIGGYTIPEGTMVMQHLTAVLHDEKNWKDPMIFRPERFLDDAGNVVVPDCFIPFSIGRRSCPGDALAKLELFIFITNIFQKFSIQPEDPDNLPSLEPVFGLTCTTKPFKIRFIPRDN